MSPVMDVQVVRYHLKEVLLTRRFARFARFELRQVRRRLGELNLRAEPPSKKQKARRSGPRAAGGGGEVGVRWG